MEDEDDLALQEPYQYRSIEIKPHVVLALYNSKFWLTHQAPAPVCVRFKSGRVKSFAILGRICTLALAHPAINIVPTNIVNFRHELETCTSRACKESRTRFSPKNMRVWVFRGKKNLIRKSAEVHKSRQISNLKSGERKFKADSELHIGVWKIMIWLTYSWNCRKMMAKTCV